MDILVFLLIAYLVWLFWEPILELLISLPFGAGEKKDRRRYRKAAEKILREQKSLYSSLYEITQADLQDFPFLDAQHYQSSLASLQGRGFRFLADVENLTVTRIYPHTRTMIRTMSSSDGAIMAGIYHYKNRGFSRHMQRWYRFPTEARITEFETEFSDGTFLATANTGNIDRTSDVPGVTRQQHPIDTDISTILEDHKKALAARLAADPSLGVTRVVTCSEAQDLQNRLQALKNRHKQAIGYLDQSELERIAGPALQKESALVAEEIDALKRSGKA